MLSVWAGEVVYEEAWRWQRLLAAARGEDAIDDVLLTLTHDPVYTAGRHADLARNLLGTRPDIRVVQVDRGGDVTYHGPGQLVAYPIIRLPQPRGVRAYVSALEEACIRTAASFGVQAGRRQAQAGVWVGDAKLAAIGVRVRRGITTHGLALNVATDPGEFAGIVPCGIPGAGVCSLASLGVEATLTEVRRRLVAHLGDALDRPIQPATPADLGLTAVVRVPARPQQ
ncbi:MAG: lipoyl(octanoyl) transferase LipB [Egibacteraceae bacterium]